MKKKQRSRRRTSQTKSFVVAVADDIRRQDEGPLNGRLMVVDRRMRKDRQESKKDMCRVNILEASARIASSPS